jgi:hypothetical protein
MNKYFFLALLYLIPFKGRTQKPEPLNWQVIYDFKHVYDTSLKDQPLQEKHQLLVALPAAIILKGLIFL